MSEPGSTSTGPRRGPRTMAWIGGALVSLAAAVALFTRYGLDNTMSRDESIYAYAGQQLAHGVLPYASIFDPKTPMASTVAGVAAALARLVGRNDVDAIRAAFMACAVLSVVAVYALTAHLFRSVLAGLVAAVTLAACRVFAVDALAGPDAKTPGVLFAALAMWLMATRRWFWAGFAGALAFLVWQPLILYPAVAVLVAMASEPRGRLRAGVQATIGSVVPVAVAALCFAVTGTFSDLVQNVLVYPLQGVERRPETVVDRLEHIARTVQRYDGQAAVLFWVGLVLLVCLTVARLAGVAVGGAGSTAGSSGLRGRLVDPLVCVVSLTLLLNVGYALTDFQSYPDLYAFVLYPSIGLGGGAAVLVGLARRRTPRLVVGTAVVVALALLVGLSWAWFGSDSDRRNRYPSQLSVACGLSRTVVPGTPLLSLGNPTPLVLTRRRNPDPYVYLAAGVDRWKLRDLAGGFQGWTAQITRAAPSVVVVNGWEGPYRTRMGDWLKQNGYQVRFLGGWRVFVTQQALRRAQRHDVELSRAKTQFAETPGGRPLPEPVVRDARAASPARCPVGPER